MLKLLHSSFSPLRICPEVVPGQGWQWGTICEVNELSKLSAAIPSRVEAAPSLAVPLPDQHSPSQPNVRLVPEGFPTRTEAAGAGTPLFSTALPRCLCRTIVPTPQCHRNADTHFWCLRVLHAFGVALCPWYICHSWAVAVSCLFPKGALSGWTCPAVSLHSAS